MGKLNKLRQMEESEEVEKKEESSSDSSSDESEDNAENTESPIKKKPEWKNRERVLIFCARGADFRARHLMNDLKSLMPHTKGESKLDKQVPLPTINEIAEMKNCTKTIYFENRKHKDLYLWMSNIGDGPSAKFLVHNVHTMFELKLSGNCLKASRPVLSFDSAFDDKPHLTLMKHLLTQIFATPNYHPRSQPFIDHVFSFSVTPDGKIWFRNFQIVDETLQLQEIGPRMVLELIRIFAGSFEGEVLYDNPNYVSPNDFRRAQRQKKAEEYGIRKDHQKAVKEKMKDIADTLLEKVPDPVGEIYDTEREIEDKEALAILKKIDAPTKRNILKRKKMEKKRWNEKKRKYQEA